MSRSVIRQTAWLFFPAIALATLLAFLPALSNGFVNWDDPVLIVKNPHIRKLDWDLIKWMFTSLHMGPYQPLSWLSLAIDYSIWGVDPRGFHCTSLLIHAANAVSFCVLSRRLLKLTQPKIPEGSPLFGACAALSATLFAIHPLRVESVVWVSERRDVLAGFFMLWAVWAYLKLAESNQPGPRVGWYATSLLLFALSLLAKATALGLPAVLTILDVYPLRRLGRRYTEWGQAQSWSVWLEKLPYWALSITVAGLAILGQHAAGALASLEKYGLLQRLAIACFGSVFYIWKTLLPIDLSPLYELPAALDPLAGRFVFSATAALTATGLMVWFRTRAPGLLATWLCYLILLAPVSGVAQSGQQIAADRYSYLPCLGFALLAGGVVLQWLRCRTWSTRWGGLAAMAITLVVYGVLGPLTWRQSQVWRDSGTLWKHVMAIDPTSDVAHTNLGKWMLETGRLTEAQALLTRATELRPDNAAAHNNLGVVLRRSGKVERALEHYVAAMRLEPGSAEPLCNVGYLLAEDKLLPHLGFPTIDEQWRSAADWYSRALALEPNHLLAINGLAYVYHRLGQTDRAIALYERALRADSDNVESHYNLANILIEQGADDAAMVHYRRVLALEPKHPESCNNLALLHERRGQRLEAMQLLREGLTHSAEHQGLLYNLGRILANSPRTTERGAVKEAVDIAERLDVMTRGEDPRVLDLLAAAYAQLGRLADAQDVATHAAEIASKRGDVELAGQIEERLKLYRSGQAPSAQPR